jgi:ATP-dependent Zn protease
MFHLFFFSLPLLPPQVDVALAGREAELLVFASASDRTGDDLSTATKIATKMVKEYGYSDKVGLMTVIGDRASYFLSRNSKKRVEDAVKEWVVCP